jgi:hypothetical protein
MNIAVAVTVTSEAVGLSCSDLNDEATHFFHIGTDSESIII